MKAQVFRAVGKIDSQDLPIPVPAKGEVLLRVVGCGVCGTDYHMYSGELTDGVCPPVVLGHEIASRVEELGSGVRGLKAGQFCAVDPVIGCGVCPACRSGRPNLCSDPQVIGYKLNGGFAQYVLVPAGKVVPLDESAGLAGGVLCETLACVIHGYDRLGFRAAASAMILGAGTVGLLWTAMLSSSPCSLLIQSEPLEFRRRKAAELGAHVVIDPNKVELAEAVRAACPEGVDFIIDATGNPDAVEQALPLVARGGTFVVFGVCPAEASIRVNPFELYNKETRIIASKMPPGTLDRSARLIESRRIPCDKIVTETTGLAALPEAVASFNDRRDRQVKVAIDPWK
jgi:L-iditol 2-dehydrogenase